MSEDFLDEVMLDLRHAGVTKDEAKGGFNISYRRFNPTDEHSFIWLPSVPFFEETNKDLIDVFEHLSEEYGAKEIDSAIERQWRDHDFSRPWPILQMPAYRVQTQGFDIDNVEGLVKVVEYEGGLYARCDFDKWTYYLPNTSGTIDDLYNRIYRHIEEEHSPPKV